MEEQLERLLAAAESIFGESREDIMSRKKTHGARIAITTLLWRYNPGKRETVAAIMGRNNPSNVNYAEKVHRDFMKIYPAYAYHFEKLRKTCYPDTDLPQEDAITIVQSGKEIRITKRAIYLDEKLICKLL